jgi:hypothetical protein
LPYLFLLHFCAQNLTFLDGCIDDGCIDDGCKDRKLNAVTKKANENSDPDKIAVQSVCETWAVKIRVVDPD